MTSPGAFEGAAPARGQVFTYEGFTADGERGLLTGRYSLDGREFTERVSLAPGRGWDTPAARAAARIVYLLAGVSYYKTAAPPVIDLGGTALTDRELDFLREFYLSGLGEFAYRNGLDLSGLTIHSAPDASAPETSLPETSLPESAPDHASAPPSQPDGCGSEPPLAGPLPQPSPQGTRLRPLIPFGGGIDSIVTVEGVRKHTNDIAL
ncbi:MAG TPA: hypothetical protein VF838_10055, partial [Trebonia sp.]